jgi:hypothetical protein
MEDRWLTIEETRTVADLRIMHSKVDELYQVVSALKRHHDEGGHCEIWGAARTHRRHPESG